MRDILNTFDPTQIILNTKKNYKKKNPNHRLAKSNMPRGWLKAAGAQFHEHHSTDEQTQYFEKKSQNKNSNKFNYSNSESRERERERPFYTTLQKARSLALLRLPSPPLFIFF